MLHGKAIEDILALAALVAFHRVNADALQGETGLMTQSRLSCCRLDGSTESGYLVAVGNDDTHRLVCIKMGCLFLENLDNRTRHDSGLGYVDLVRG